METQINTVYDLKDDDAPESKELLIEQAFDGIMKLSEDTRTRLHKKYLERYGWHVE